VRLSFLFSSQFSLFHAQNVSKSLFLECFSHYNNGRQSTIYKISSQFCASFLLKLPPQFVKDNFIPKVLKSHSLTEISLFIAFSLQHSGEEKKLKIRQDLNDLKVVLITNFQIFKKKS